MTRLLPLLLLVTLPFAGCRDALVDPGDEGGPAPATSELPTPYFKGPTEMSVGDSGSFRVEAVVGAAEYRWFFDSGATTGQLAGSFSTDGLGNERFFSGQATGTGRVVLTVSVFDADGRLIAGNTKTVLIAPN